MTKTLLYQTPIEWAEVPLADFGSFLQDHANCERKASAMALKLAVHYPDREQLVDDMLQLATEELLHFRQCYSLLKERGLGLVADEKDPYVGGLRSCFRKGGDCYFLDRLLISGIIEARGTERFALVAEALEAGSLRDFYTRLAAAEARHHQLFERLARVYFPREAVDRRLQELLEMEARLVQSLPWRASLH